MKLARVGILTGLWGMSVLGCASAADEAEPTELDPPAIQQELSAHALTKDQARAVLELVDGICGDTWCEGDYNFRFERIECTPACKNQPGTCRLSFRMFPYDTDPNGGEAHARSCRTSGFTSFASLVDTAANGYQSLNWSYYDALSACINELEGQLPPP